MIRKVDNNTVKAWFVNCEKIMSKYSTDCSLPMIIEWALHKNYIQLKACMNEYVESLKMIEDAYGTLQPDGTKKIDATSNTVMEMYKNEVDVLNRKLVELEIEMVNHNLLKGFKGVSLETMALLSFMIS